MKHIRKMVAMEDIDGNPSGDTEWSLCDVFPYEDTLVEAALESDCDVCRTRANIAAKREKVGIFGKPAGVSPGVPEYEPRPMPGADQVLDQLRRRRDGLP